MNKTSLIVPFVRLMFTDTRALLKDILHFTLNQNARRRVLEEHGLPDGLPSVNLLDLLPEFEEEIDSYTFLDGTSRPIDIALIKGMCRRKEKCRYLEIGTWRGESIRNASQVCEVCYSVSLSDKEMMEHGFQREIPFQRLFSANLPNVHHIRQSSLTFDFDSLDTTFDVIFVDGDHSYEAVKKDTESAFKLLKDDSSIIIWHDYGTELPRWPVLAGILDGSPTSARGNLYSVTNTLCAIYTKAPVKSAMLLSPQTPDKTFRVMMRAEPLDPS